MVTEYRTIYVNHFIFYRDTSKDVMLKSSNYLKNSISYLLVDVDLIFWEITELIFMIVSRKK